MKTQAGKMRQVVNVMRPPATTDDLGGLIGQPKLIRKDVPCSIRNISGTETEQVHSVWPSATQIIEFYADPLRQVTPQDYLTGGTLGERKLYINAVTDEEEKGLILTLVCEEAK